MTVGEKIKEIRLSRNLTQDQLGELCGTHGSAIRRYENGHSQPKFETIIKIAEQLKVPPLELMCDWPEFQNLIIKISGNESNEFKELKDIIYKYSSDLYQTARRAQKQGVYDIIFDDVLFGVVQDFICNSNQDIINKLNDLIDNLDSFKDANNIYDGEKIRYFLRSK